MRLRNPTFNKAVCAVLLSATLAAAGSGAQEDFQIRARVDLVVVPVTVKSRGDRPVHGLTRDDFVVLEDGRPQRITNFTPDPVPLSAVIFIDTGLSAASLEKVQASFTALAESFSDFDEVAVYRFDTYVRQLIDFSSDRTAIEAAMKTLQDIEPLQPTTAFSGGPFSTPGPTINSVPIAPSARAPIPPKNSKVLHDALFEAALALGDRDAERRKIVIVISDGRDAGSEHSYEGVIGRLLNANIQVFGLGMDMSFFTRRLSVLHSYARDTGGDAIFLSSLDALQAGFARLTEQARNQYVLGYVSDQEVAGPGPVFRRIEVRLVPSGLDALHRRGYYQYPENF